MLRPFINYDELRASHPAYGWVWSYAARPDVEQCIRAASFAVSGDLRRKGIDDRRICVPLMFDDDDPGDTHTRIATYTSSGVESLNERRLVLEVSAGACTIELQGLVKDSDPETWADIPSLLSNTTEITATDIGLYSVRFVPRFPEYRYVITPDTTCTYSCYLVDDAADELMYLASMMKILEGRAGQDESVTASYARLQQDYDNAISRFVADYQSADGTVEENGVVTHRVRVSR